MPIKGLKLHGRRLRLAIVGASAFVALIAAISSIYEIQLLPPSIQKRDLQLGVAATNAIVDYRSEGDGASIADLVSYNDLEAMTERTEPLARVMTSEALLDRIGKQLGVEPEPDLSDHPGHPERSEVVDRAGQRAAGRRNPRRTGVVPDRGPSGAEPAGARHLRGGADARRGHEPRRHGGGSAQRLPPRPGPQGRHPGHGRRSSDSARRRARRPGRRDRSVEDRRAHVRGRLRGLLWSGRADRRGSARLEKGVEADRRGSGRGRGRVYPSAQRAAARDNPRPRPTATRRLAAHNPAAAVDDRRLHRHALARSVQRGVAQRLAPDRPQPRPPRAPGDRAHLGGRARGGRARRPEVALHADPRCARGVRLGRRTQRRPQCRGPRSNAGASTSRSRS